MTEKEFQDSVFDLAQRLGYIAYHNPDSRRSTPGFPDAVLLRPPRLLFVEFKSQKGKLRPEQAVWLDGLAASGAEVRLWRPSDWDEIVETLR